MDINNKTLALFLVGAIIISLAGTIISLNRLAQIGPTGYATVVANATATLDVSTVTSIRYAQNAINFGTGSVNTSYGNQYCYLTVNASTFTKNGCTAGGFTGSPTAFQVENDGNTYLSVTMNCSSNSTTFLGGTGPSMKFTVAHNESSSCIGNFSSYNASWTELGLPSATYIICTNLSYADASDSLLIGVNLTIPYDSFQSARIANWSVVGTG
jgi:hypothetical protein